MCKGFRKRWQSANLSSDDEHQDTESSTLEGASSMPSEPVDRSQAGSADQPALAPSQPGELASAPDNLALQAAQAKRAAKSPTILMSKPKVKMARASQAVVLQTTAAAQIRQAILETPACAPIKMPQHKV